MHVMNACLFMCVSYYINILSKSTIDNLCNPSQYKIGSIVGGTNMEQSWQYIFQL